MTVSPSAMPAQGVDQDGDVEDALLEQVADPLGVLLDQPHRVARLDVLGEHEHADAGCSARIRWAATRPSSVWVGGIRMSTIATSGRVAAHLAQQRRRASSACADDVDAGVLEQAHDPLAGQHRVLGDDYAHGISARSVPSSIADSAAERADTVGEVGSPWSRSEPSSSMSTTSRASSRSAVTPT